MQSPSVVIAQNDPRLARELARQLQIHFRDVRVIASLPLLREEPIQPVPLAVIVDLEWIGFPELRNLCNRWPESVVVCTHRLPDDEMWVDSLGAGATDCCHASDMTSILRAISGAGGPKRRRAAA